MPNSSLFIELMMHAIFGPKCKNAKKKIGKKSLNVLNVKLLSREIFNVFGVYYMLFVSNFK